MVRDVTAATSSAVLAPAAERTHDRRLTGREVRRRRLRVRRRPPGADPMAADRAVDCRSLNGGSTVSARARKRHEAGKAEVVEELRHARHDPRDATVVPEPGQAAGRFRRLDRARNEEALPPLLEGPCGREERAAACPRLDDDHRVRQATDDPVAARKRPAARLDARSVLRDHRPARIHDRGGEAIVRQARAGRGRRRSRRRSGPPRPTTAAWAAPSIPNARPLTTTAPARANAAPMRPAIRRPASVGRRVPTTATAAPRRQRRIGPAHEENTRREFDRPEAHRVAGSSWIRAWTPAAR